MYAPVSSVCRAFLRLLDWHAFDRFSLVRPECPPRTPHPYSTDLSQGTSSGDGQAKATFAPIQAQIRYPLVDQMTARRTEVELRSGAAEEDVVFALLGLYCQTRHLIL